MLSYSGPVVITVPLAAWFVLLVIGWAMIYKPALGTAVAALSGPTDTGWATAIYFSGFSLTTAGADEYIALRAQWDRPLRDLAEAMLYEWESI